MHFLLLAAAITWTNPTTDALVDSLGNFVGCVGTLPCTDLQSVQVWGRDPAQDHDTLLAVLPADPGCPMSFTIPVESAFGVWLVPVDSTGNVGCRSRPVLINATLSVGQNVPPQPGHPPASGLPSIQWYDVTGRRIDTPQRRGVYYYRVGNIVTKYIYLYR